MRSRAIATLVGAALLGGCSASGVFARPEQPPGHPGETTNVPPDVQRALQRELHELHLAQERYQATHERYAETLFDLRFTPSSGVVVRLHEATERGFSATAGRASYECALFVGDISSPRAYARDPSVIACENTPTRVIGIRLGRSEAAVYSKASEKGIPLKPTNQAPDNRRK